MNLNTITEVKRPASADQITHWRDGYAWLAGGTWLFSEPQVATDTLIDLEALGWPALEASPAGLDIAATCPIAELYRFAAPPRMARGAAAARVLPTRSWCRSRSGTRPPSAATSACRCRPAPMISLTVALEGHLHACGRATRRRARCRRSISSPATTPTCCSRASCCAASTCRRRRCRSGSRSATPRSPTRPLGGAADRHAERGRPTISCSPSPRRRRARSSCGSSTCRPRSSCGARSTSVSRPTDISTTSTARPPTSATSPTISPSRSAPSWRNRSAHMNMPSSRPRVTGRRQPHDLQRQWQAVLRRAAARTMPAHLPARARRVRRQEGLRRRRLRRLHGLARRHADSFLPDAGLPRRRARSDHDRGTGAGRRRCIRCSRRFSMRRPSSAASARRA